MNYGITLHISGDYALFSRPEMKVERVSYDVMTPSAALMLVCSSTFLAMSEDAAINWSAAWVIALLRVSRFSI